MLHSLAGSHHNLVLLHVQVFWIVLWLVWSHYISGSFDCLQKLQSIVDFAIIRVEQIGLVVPAAIVSIQHLDEDAVFAENNLLGRELFIFQGFLQRVS